MVSAWHYWFLNKLTYIVQNSKCVSIRNKIVANGNFPQLSPLFSGLFSFGPSSFPVSVPASCLLKTCIQNMSLDMTFSFSLLLTKRDKITPFWRNSGSCASRALPEFVSLWFYSLQLWKWHKNTRDCSRVRGMMMNEMLVQPFTEVYSSLLVCCSFQVTGLLCNWW